MDSSKLTIIDGGTGTELQKYHDINKAGWVYRVQLDNPEAVSKVHNAYVKAGSKVITINTFSTNGNVMEPLGDRANVGPAITAAVVAARKATAGTDVKICGSIGFFYPKNPKLGTHEANQPENQAWPKDLAHEITLWEETVAALLENNVDMIFIEMAKEYTHLGCLAKALGNTMARMQTTCPVYLGLTVTRESPNSGCQIDRDNFNNVCSEPLVFRPCEASLDSERFLPLDKAAVLKFQKMFNDAGVALTGFNIMHTKAPFVLDALKVIREDAGYTGPLGVYPDVGFWDGTKWDSSSAATDQLLVFYKKWVDYGVSMIGGCCGVGPEIIKALVAAYGENGMK